MSNKIIIIGDLNKKLLLPLLLALGQIFFITANELFPQKIVKQAGKEICILIRGLKLTSLKAIREKYSLIEFDKVSELCDN